MPEIDLGLVKGERGLSASVKIGAVTTLAPGKTATVENVGTENEAVLTFGIPQGLHGESGDGSGDMLKSVYDNDNDGVVDNAAALGGKSPEQYAAAGHEHSALDIAQGVLAVERGGTGATSTAAALEMLGGVSNTLTINGHMLSGDVTLTAADVNAAEKSGLDGHADNKDNPHEVTATQIGAAAASHTHAASDISSGVLALSQGGTGESSASAARTALGCAPAYSYGTLDKTAGSSSLATGTLYFMYT